MANMHWTPQYTYVSTYIHTYTHTYTHTHTHTYTYTHTHTHTCVCMHVCEGPDGDWQAETTCCLYISHIVTNNNRVHQQQHYSTEHVMYISHKITRVAWAMLIYRNKCESWASTVTAAGDWQAGRCNWITKWMAIQWRCLYRVSQEERT